MLFVALSLECTVVLLSSVTQIWSVLFLPNGEDEEGKEHIYNIYPPSPPILVVLFINFIMTHVATCCHEAIEGNTITSIYTLSLQYITGLHHNV